MFNNDLSISIIIPVYNSKNYLSSCIDSIINQKGSFSIQLIIVDDGSTDGSFEFIESKYSKINFIEIYRIDHSGQSKARNFGLSIAKNSLISFIDSDDLIPSDYFLKLTHYFTIEDVDLVCCPLVKFKFDNDLIFKRLNLESTSIKFTKNSALEELPNNKLITFSPTNKIYRRKLFDNISFKEDTIFEDLDLSYKLINKCRIVIYSSSTNYFYRIHSNSTMTSAYSLKRIDEFNRKKDLYFFYSLSNLSLNIILLTKIIYIYSGIIVFIKMDSKVNIKNISFLIDFNKNYLKEILFRSRYLKINFLILSLFISKKIIVFYRFLYKIYL